MNTTEFANVKSTPKAGKSVKVNIGGTASPGVARAGNNSES